jgi:hypothetical protein
MCNHISGERRLKTGGYSWNIQEYISGKIRCRKPVREWCTALKGSRRVVSNLSATVASQAHKH